MDPMPRRQGVAGPSAQAPGIGDARAVDTIGGMVRAAAAIRPDHAALATVDAPPLTYRALVALLDETESRLNAIGLGRGDRIGIALEGRATMAAAVLAVSSCAVAAPLDPAGSEPEFTAAIQALRLAAIVVATDAAAGARAAARAAGIPVVAAMEAPGDAAGVFRLSGPARGVAARPGPARGDDVAMVLRTSGTTGESKIVPRRHKAIMALAVHSAAWFCLGPDDRFLHVQSPYHGSGTNTSLFPALPGGGTVVLPRTAALDDVLAAFARFEPTFFAGNPAFYAALLDHIRQHGVPPGFGRLRAMLSSTAALPSAVIDALQGATGVPVIQRYSMTEANGLICANPMPPGLNKPGSVGLPVERPIRLIDDAGRDVGTGAVGEVLIGGDAIFDGYENDPAGNRDTFHDGWLRSGDFGRLDDDGYLYLVGRRKDSIKRGGQTVIPAEIDDALLADPDIADAVAFPMPHPTLGEVVAAAVVPRGGAAPTPESILARLRGRLMPHKVPQHVVVADALPRDQHGKIARRALARHFGLDTAAHRHEAAVATTRAPTPLEAALIGIWKANLGAGHVGPDDDFFALGGDSLKAAQILAAVDTVFGVRLELAATLSAGLTVGALARAIEAARTSSGGAPAPPATAPRPRPRPRNAHATRFPASFGQERLWFIEQIAPDAAVYNEAQAYRLRGALDLDALASAYQALVDRHESLRTAFRSEDGTPCQEIVASVAARLDVHDLSALATADREAEIARRWTAAALTPFDLTRPPLLRLVVLRLDAQDFVLMRVIHHIVSDAWSNGVLRRDLSALYRAARTGVPATLPPLEVQYADCTVWQRARAETPAFARSLDYWTRQLAGSPSALALPTDFARPPVPSHEGGTVVARIPAGLISRLEALAAAENATLFMALLAAFNVLLARCSGQTDIVVGTPIAGRDTPEAEPLIGFFVNTLALRADLGDGPPFRAFLGQVRRTVLDAFAHQAVPFERIVDRLHIERSRSANPLVQVLFAFQNVPQVAWDLDAVAAERLDLQRERAKVDLTFTVTADDDGAQAVLTYATDLFEPATAETLTVLYLTLLEQIAQEPDRAVTTLPRAAPAPADAVAWPTASVADLFAASVLRSPDAIAVVDGDRSISYRALDDAAERLAGRLAAAGVGRHDRVGILGDRSAGFVVAVLAVVKAGAVYVPLDPQQPQARLDAILDDAGIAVAVTVGPLADRLAGRCRVVRVEDDHADRDPAAAPGGRLAARDPDDPLYVIYTSGSTGKPKGVVVAQRGVVRLVVGTRYVSLPASGTVAHLSNVAFDAATFELWGALLNGARLAVASPDTVRDPAALARWIGAARIDTMFMTAALFSRVAEASPGCFRGVDQLLVGGDRVSPSAVRAVLAAGRPRRLLNAYGPTETTTFAICHEIAALPASARSVPIGRPIDGTAVRVCDEAGGAVPPLVVGEILIGGPGVALGYQGNPALTAARFIEDPQGHGAPGRLYRTGDLARRLPDGAIDFIGRRDRQVKIRGYRIEPVEIETALRHIPQVGEAHVAARAHDGETQLLSYVVPATGHAIDVAAVRAALRQMLPPYMLPRAIVPVVSLPLSANGKIDEARLPAHDDAAPATARRAPRDELETAIAAVWRDVLGVTDIGIDDNFFDLGGHSLLAARLFARLDVALGRTLPISVLFEAPTVALLAQAYGDPAAAPSAARFKVAVPIQPHGTRLPVFAVPGLGGNVIGFSEVARLLGPDQPFYGLQSVGLDGAEAPLETIAAIAARFIAEVRLVQPRGPYRLLGACLGAAAALEMAHQLRQAGEEIEFLGFLDPSGLAGRNPGRGRAGVSARWRARLAVPRFAARRIGDYWRAVRALDPRGQAAFVADRIRLLRDIVKERDLFRGDRREFHQRQVEDANLHALLRYEPRPFPGVVHILASTRANASRRANGPRLDWTTLGMDGCELIRLASTDSGNAVLPPHVHDTVAALARWLAAADRRRAKAARPAA